MKAAAIDLGTNAFRLLIKDIKNSNTETFRYREIVGLGKYLSNNNLELPKIYYSSLERIFEYIKKYNVKKVYTVGTSVFRESDNKGFIINDFKIKFKHDLNIIDSETEAELTTLGVMSSIDNIKDNKILIDIGGGSTEIIFVNKNKFIFYDSLNIGVIKLLNLYNTTEIFSDNLISEIKIKIRNFLNKNINHRFRELKNFKLIFNAGTPATIASIFYKLNKFDRDKINGCNLGYDFSKKTLNKLYKLSSKERLKIPGIEVGREQVIVYGILILLEFLDFFKIDKYSVSNSGVLEGIFKKYIEI